MATQLESPELYTIAWIAALPIERAAATALFHEVHNEPAGFNQHETDSNSYSWGRLGQHNIVIASLPAGVYGTTSAASTASELIHSLPHIRIALLVGIGGGISNPDENQDIRLGDVVVSQPEGTTGGVVQYDLVKAKVGGVLEQKGSLNKPPPVLLHALASLQAQHEMMPSKIPEILEGMWNRNNRYMTKKKTNYTYPGRQKDRLFKSKYDHIDGPTCADCDPEWEVKREERDSTDPEIHYGIIASGNTLIKDAAVRDSLSERHQFLCVEMEAAGLMDRFPCLVIRGICDYADSHKNDGWQRYAAATAAAFVVELLEYVPVKKVQETQQVIEVVKGLEDKIMQVEDGMNKLGVSVDNIDLNVVLDRLPDAAGARFDSQAEEHNPKCLANTRVDLLRDISSWISDEASKPILWLNGMAGTGKSTIARTVARDRSKDGDLGASFFFKRGEADRGSLLRFVPSITRQLARNVPEFAQAVKVALDSDPDITSKSVAKQFAALVEAPIVGLIKKTSRFAIIIDALDECEGDEEIKSLIHTLSRTSPIQHCLRILITSRPDLPVRLGFAKINGSYRALILHDMPADTIKQDIMAFLLDEFETIRDDFNSLAPKELELPTMWPGEAVIDRLTNMAIPLFIFAATVCRFVKDYKVDSPSNRLSKYFQLSNDSYGSHLGQIYGPVLQSIISGIPKEDARQIVQQTRQIVGSIIILATPLSVMAISKLLDVSVNLVHIRLNALHSILNIPPNLYDTVRLLHISLRDYLIDPSQSDKNEFWVDERDVHLELFKNSLRVMESSLEEDICHLVWPGTGRHDVRPSQIASYIPDELQYACCHWVYHLQRVESPSLNKEEVFMFLHKHLFHWLETLSLIGRFKESLQAIKVLKNIIKTGQSTIHEETLTEILRFLQVNSTIINLYPLQLYSSLLYSIPSDSILDQLLGRSLPLWLQHAPEPYKTSDQAKYILEGYESTVDYCAISLDNLRLVSCSWSGGEMRIWNLETTECIRVITNEGPLSTDIALSYDGSWLAVRNYVDGPRFSGSEEEKGDARGEEGSDASTTSKLLWPRALRLWNVDCEQFIDRMFVQRQDHGQLFRFSPDSKLIVFMDHSGAAIAQQLDRAQPPQQTYLTYRKTGTEGLRPYRNIKGQDGLPICYIEFCTDSSLLTIVSVITGRYVIWETQTLECIRYQKINRSLRHVFHREPDQRHEMSFALTGDASIMMAGALSEDILDPSLLCRNNGQLEIRWLESGVLICTIDCKGEVIKTQFSPDQTVLASICSDGSVRTWRVATGECLTTFETNQIRDIQSISLSPNLDLISSSQETKTATVWANVSRETDERSKKISDPIESVVLSSDYSLVASSSRLGSVKVWDTNTRDCLHQFDGGQGGRRVFDDINLDLLQFTKDKRFLFAAWTKAIDRQNTDYRSILYLAGHFRGWDLDTSQEVISLQTKIHVATVIYRGSTVCVTPDDRWIISASDRKVTIIAIDTFSATREVAFPCHIYDIAVSPNSQYVFVLMSDGETLHVFDDRDKDWEGDADPEFSLSMFSIIKVDEPVTFAMPNGTLGILASLKSDVLVLQTSCDLDWPAVPVILGEEVKVLCEFESYMQHFAPTTRCLTQQGSTLLSFDTSTLDFRNSFTGELIQQMPIFFGHLPRRLCFDAYTQHIHTNFGTISTHEEVSDDCHDGFSLDKHLVGLGISSDRSWLLWKDKRMFWLPPAFRPHSSTVEVVGSTIIIGTESGRVLFFKFNTQDRLEHFY